MLSRDWDAGKMREGGRCELKRFAENADSCPREVFVECLLCLGVGSRCSCPLLFINPIQSNGEDGGLLISLWLNRQLRLPKNVKVRIP